MEYLEHFTTFIQIMAGINFAFIVVDSIKNAIKYLFDSSNLLSDKNKETDAQIAADIVSVESMNVIRTTDGLSNEAALSELKNNFNGLKDYWAAQHSSLKKDIDDVQATNGFPVLFLYTSIYSVFALLIIGISCSIPYSWDLEFFVCIFNIICAIEMGYYIGRVVLRKNARITIESIYCILGILGALLSAGIVLGINKWFVNNGLAFQQIPWLCTVFESLFILLPTIAMISTVVYLFIKDLYFKCRIRKLYNDYQSKYGALHADKLNMDKFYRQFRKPTYGI